MTFKSGGVTRIIAPASTTWHLYTIFCADAGFHWTDRSSFQYEKWNLGEPNSNGNDDEDCVYMYTKGHDEYHWDDVACDEYHPFMCKAEQGIIYPTLYNKKISVSGTLFGTRLEEHVFFMMTSSNGNISALLAICVGNSPVTGEFPA